MEMKIIKQLPEWSNSNKTKRIVIVMFENCPFKWVPTYPQLKEIKKALEEIEVESWDN